MANNPDTLQDWKQRFNQETAKITWSELERFFARGRVLCVHPSLDLIDVAIAMKNDDTAQLTQWTQATQVQHLPDNVAKQWATREYSLWAVVIAPWVLVQAR